MNVLNNIVYDFFFFGTNTLGCLPLESKMLHLNVEYLQEHYEEPESHVGGFRHAG